MKPVLKLALLFPLLCPSFASAYDYTPFVSASYLYSSNYHAPLGAIGFMFSPDGNAMTGIEYSSGALALTSSTRDYLEQKTGGKSTVKHESAEIGSLYIFHRFLLVDFLGNAGLKLGLSVDNFLIQNSFQASSSSGDFTSRFLAVSPHVGINSIWRFAKNRALISVDWLELSKPWSWASSGLEYGRSVGNNADSHMHEIASRVSSQFSGMQITFLRVGAGYTF